MNSLFPESSVPAGGKAVLISIKPKYTDLILAGSKRVELRRSWAPNDVHALVIYSSAPVQKLVGIAYIDCVKETNIDGLWDLAQLYGGGVTEAELKEYFDGKKTAFGLMIKSVDVAEQQLDPRDILPDFTPPQSFMYLPPAEYRRIEQAMFPARPIP